MDDNNIATLQKAAADSPESAAAQAALGNALLESGKFKEAAQSFKNAIELDERNASYHAALGRVYQEQHSFGRAQAEFRIAMRLDPENTGYDAELGQAVREDRRRYRLVLFASLVRGCVRLAAGALALLALAAVVLLSIPDLKSQLLSHQSSQPASCGSAAEVASASSASSAATATAKLLGGQRSEADFGRALISRTLTVDLSLSTVPTGGAVFQVEKNQFLRSDDASLNPSDISVNAVRDGKVLVLSVCFDRHVQNQPLGDPGSYSGSVTIDDRRLTSPVTIPLTVTMQYSNGDFLLWLYFAAVIPGAWCVWVLRTRRDGNESALSLKFLKWAGTVSGLVALVSGGIAAFAVYTAVYLRDPTWGYSGLQSFTLYGGMFSAFVTTSGLASLTSQKSNLLRDGT